ncbi:inner membrane protein YhjD [Mycolicibacter arupensis]|jgi:membrane protein|uniref:Membrane protein n=1 Tax=Mycolicibacter arupensis TaxID=342002 RepID=A0A0F5MVS6_9MYCO|nr:inner membrane protein YhjD [Mycolicibacter arupensis]KAA1433081.1 inner membrane protein YhjD [Mycolicibacter arupensis]KKB98865.1 membrane protein [Mycolicibacter arupensis]MCV7276052.1 inner membrane protein YhjD [Mycolicibacter arupensis]ORA01205.1 inner membrane protein YhjD [Mycolicibacter arupensis]TXI58951.1 MAG: inner membrane protein YhjD [Mycolicibacter arupensis]
MNKAVAEQTEPSKPGIIDRLRARYGWLDHVVRAQERYDDRQGNFFAAGMSYYTIFALFPLAMVGFSVGGFLLSRRPEVLDEIERRIKHSIPGEFGTELVTLMDSAISSRASVGVIGLATAGWVGLTWMANLREALSEMWESRSEKQGFVSSKLSDLLAMVWAFGAMLITIALTALADPKLMRNVLRWMGVPDFTLLGGLLRVASLTMAAGVSWLLFTWMIARLPRESVSLDSAMEAGAIAAVGYELFKQAGSVYLQSVINGPAGAVFGPVLGLLVFAYVTTRLILFATAWAATSTDAATSRPAPGTGS